MILTINDMFSMKQCEQSDIILFIIIMITLEFCSESCVSTWVVLFFDDALDISAACRLPCLSQRPCTSQLT